MNDDWHERTLGAIDADIGELYRHLNYHQITEGEEHRALSRALLHSVRNLNIHVFVLPYENGAPWPEGSAFVLRDDDTDVIQERHITICMTPNNRMFFHVLLHEWVHHAMRHCDVYTSVPNFIIEYETEQKTLHIAKQLVSQGLLEYMTQQAKIYILTLYSRYADAGLTLHLSDEIADWCGYRTNKKARRALVKREAKWNRESKTSLTSNELSQLPF